MMRKLSWLIIAIFVISGCSNYDLDDAIKEKAVIEGPGGPLNVERLDQFVMDVRSAKESSLRIVSFDDEGKSNIRNLAFKKDKIHYQYQYRRFYNSSRITKEETTCNGLRVENNSSDSSNTEYILTECEKVIGIEGPGKNEILIYTIFK